jgi:branched-chain amino acid transport system ATP-binding protein
MTEAPQPALLLQARGLAISFGGVHAARDISIDVYEHERLAIIGQNGAGKSTFLNMCTGYLRPEAGQVVYRARDITRLTPHEIARLGIARAFQHPQVFIEHTVLDNLRFASSACGGFWQGWCGVRSPRYDDKARELAALFRLEGVTEKRVSETSEGTRKLLDIAMALALEPRLLMLDEPTSGVSAEDKFKVMDTLRDALDIRGVAAVFVEHDMDVVRNYAERVAVWVEGRILAAGPPDDVLHDPRVLESVL